MFYETTDGEQIADFRLKRGTKEGVVFLTTGDITNQARNVVSLADGRLTVTAAEEDFECDLAQAVETQMITLSCRETGEIRHIAVEGLPLFEGEDIDSEIGRALIIVWASMEVIGDQAEELSDEIFELEATIAISKDVCGADELSELRATSLADAFERWLDLAAIDFVALSIWICAEGRFSEALTATVTRHAERSLTAILTDELGEESGDHRNARWPSSSPAGPHSFEEIVKTELEPFRITNQQILTKIAAISHSLERESNQVRFLLALLGDNLPQQRRKKAQNVLERRSRQWRHLPNEARNELTAALYLTDDVSLNSSQKTPLVLAAIGMAAEATGREIPGTGAGAGLASIIRRVTRQDLVSTEFETLPSLLSSLQDLRDAAVHGKRSLTATDVSRAWEAALGDQDEPGCFDLLVLFSQRSQT